MSFNFENPQTGHKFFMKWDTLERKTHYKVPKRASSSTLTKAMSKTVASSTFSSSNRSIIDKGSQFPFTWRERERLSHSMTATEVLQTSEYVADNPTRRQRKWKEMRYFWNKTVHDKVYSGNLENAFWSFGTAKMSVNQFIVTIVKEYKIENDLTMESHLRWLYYSLEGGKEGSADWRELFSIITVMTLFRLIKKKPEEVLMKIFNIYSSGGEKNKSSLDDMYLSNKQEILQILKIPVMSDYEQSSIIEFFDTACGHMDRHSRIFRQDFKEILSDNR
jgi:hypothetical protein